MVDDVTITAAPGLATVLLPGHGRPRTTPRWYADAAAVAAWITMLVVAALWVGNGGLQDLGAGAPVALTSVGRLTGLFAADLLLLQVLLMARVPVAERAFGQDR